MRQRTAFTLPQSMPPFSSYSAKALAGLLLWANVACGTSSPPVNAKIDLGDGYLIVGLEGFARLEYGNEFPANIHKTPNEILVGSREWDLDKSISHFAIAGDKIFLRMGSWEDQGVMVTVVDKTDRSVHGPFNPEELFELFPIQPTDADWKRIVFEGPSDLDMFLLGAMILFAVTIGFVVMNAHWFVLGACVVFICYKIVQSRRNRLARIRKLSNWI